MEGYIIRKGFVSVSTVRSNMHQPTGTMIFVGRQTKFGLIDTEVFDRPDYITGHYGLPAIPGKRACKNARAKGHL